MRLTKLKIFRIVAVVLFTLAIITVSGIALFVYFYPKENLLKHITSLAEQNLRRRIYVAEIDYGFKGVLLKNVLINDGPSPSDPLLVKSDEVVLKYSITSLLLDRELILESISLKNCTFTINYDKEGISNIERLISDVKKADTGSSSGARIEHLHLSNASVSLVNAPLILKPLEGSYTVTGDLYVRPDKLLQVANCHVRLPLDRGFLDPELSIMTKEDNFKIFGKVKLTKASLNWVYQWGQSITLPYQIINGNVVDLVITKDFVSGHAIATSTLKKTPLILSADGKCHVSIRGETVLISGARGTIADSSFFLQKIFFNFSGKILQFGVNDIDAKIEDVRPLLGFLPEKLTGRVNGSLSFQNNRYNGSLRLSDVAFNRQDGIITDFNTDITIINGIFRKKDIPLKLMNSPCSVSIATTDPDFKKIFIELHSKKFYLDENKLSGPKEGTPINIPIEISGKIAFDELNFSSMKFTNLNINYSIYKDTISFHNFTTQFIGGSIAGKGSIDIGQVPPHVSVSINFDSIKIQNTDIVKEKLSDRLFGQLSGKAIINFNLEKSLEKTMRGNVEVKINNGKLVNTGIQNGLGLFLSELKYKLNNLEFKTIYGNLSIDGESMRANSIIFNSENVRLKIEGVFNAKLYASPLMINLEFNKYFIRDLPGPVALGLNKYSTGNWYVIPFSCDGDMTVGKNIKRLR